jgi:hypothetical protein
MRVIPLEAGLVLPIASWVMGVLTLLVLLAIHRTLIPDSNSPLALAAILFVAWIVFEPAFVYHSLTGMDTMLSAFGIAVLTWSSLLLRQKVNGVRMAFVILSAGLSYLIRPDNLLYALLMPVLILMAGRTYSKRFPILFLAACCGLLLIDLVIKKIWLGDIVPLSFYVKQSGGLADYAALAIWNPLVYLTQFSFSLLPILVVLGMYTKKRHRASLTALLLPTILTFLYYFQVVQIMGIFARFYYPSIAPIFAASILVLSDTSADHPAMIRPGPVELRKAIVTLLCLAALVVAAYTTYSNSVLTTYPSFFQAPPLSQTVLPNLGWENSIHEIADMARNFPPGSVLAASEIGYLGASVPDLALIDLTGLNDDWIAHHGFQAQAFFARKPDFIWMPPSDYHQTLHSMVCDPEFQRSFLFFPEAYDYGVAIRRDGPFTTEIQSAFRQSWDVNYPEIRLESATARIEDLKVLCKD